MPAACRISTAICWLSSRCWALPLRNAAEYLRVITTELNRIVSHLLWLGANLLDLGAFTPILYCFDDRENFLDILEDVTGSRLTHCWYRAGGVLNDVPDGFC